MIRPIEYGWIVSKLNNASNNSLTSMSRRSALSSTTLINKREPIDLKEEPIDMIQLILDTEPNAKIIYLCPCRPWIRNLRKRKTVVAGCHFKSESMKTEKLLWTFWRSRKLFGAKRIPRKGFPSSLVVNVVLLKSSPNTQIPWTTLVLSS